MIILASLIILSAPMQGNTQTTETETKEPVKCPNQFPNLFTDICWECMFPVRIGGKIIMNTGEMPDNIAEITLNADDYNPDTYFCDCTVNGKEYLGVYISYWEPVRVLEVVRRPGCFGFLFGMDLNAVLEAPTGNKGAHPNHNLEKSFQHVHYYQAPIMELLDIMIGADFCRDWTISGLDIAYMTEVDPIWNDDELAVLIYAESAVFANTIAQAICVADCLPSTLRYPLNELFWCAGCWGSMYPMTGNVMNVGSPVAVSSLQMTRLLARLARYPIPPAMEFDTSSSLAKCGGVLRPFLKKSQYRINTLVPISEAVSFHTIGASPLIWGEWRNIPAVGEDHTFVTWRKRNCCLSLTSGDDD